MLMSVNYAPLSHFPSLAHPHRSEGIYHSVDTRGTPSCPDQLRVGRLPVLASVYIQTAASVVRAGDHYLISITVLSLRLYSLPSMYLFTIYTTLFTTSRLYSLLESMEHYWKCPETLNHPGRSYDQRLPLFCLRCGSCPL